MSGMSPLSAVAGALSTLFAPKLARQFNRMSVLGSLIPSERGMGKSINWDVEFDGATAASYAEGADVASSEFNVDTLQPAVLSWGHYRGAFQVSETQLNAAFSSPYSGEAVMKLLDERVNSTMTKLASVINGDLWNGTGTDGSSNPNIVGLLGGALGSTGTYAGLSRSTYPLWAGNLLANGGVARALTIDLLNQAEQAVFTATGLVPNVIVCDPATFRKYSNLFENVRRVEGTGPITRYDTSTGNLFYRDIPIIRDKDAPAGTLVMMNTELIKKVYLPEIDDASSDAVSSAEREGAGQSGGEGGVPMVENPMNLPFKIVALSKTGDSLKFFVKSVLNLKVERASAFCVIQDISTT
jgi:hypothetical protein